MKGTIISGEEVLKIIASGDLENISKIYEIYSTGPIQSGSIIDGWFGSISNLYLETVIKDCYDDNLTFIKIEK